jgi:hypothetical protein
MKDYPLECWRGFAIPAFRPVRAISLFPAQSSTKCCKQRVCVLDLIRPLLNRDLIFKDNPLKLIYFQIKPQIIQYLFGDYQFFCLIL